MQREGWKKDSDNKKKKRTRTRTSEIFGMSIQKSRGGRQSSDPPRAAGTLTTPLLLFLFSVLTYEACKLYNGKLIGLRQQKSSRHFKKIKNHD